MDLSALAGMFGGGKGGGGGGGMYGSGNSGTATSAPISTNQGGIASQSFIFGGNPNVQTAINTFSNPWFIAGAVVVAGLFFWSRRR